MRNPWRMQDGPDNKINRNNFPMTFQYNGTFKYGKIYPIGLWRTIPGASYQIDSTLALNFMPTSFPIQTRQRAYVHFFYGRDRNFWKDYKDFVNGMSPDLVKPYIDEGVTQARTGNLLDYLGVPTTIVGRYASGEVQEVVTTDLDYRKLRVSNFYGDNQNDLDNYLAAIPSVGTPLTIGRSSDTTFLNTWQHGFAIPIPRNILQSNGNTLDIQFKQGASETDLLPNRIYPVQNATTNNTYVAPNPRKLNNLQNLSRLIVVDSNNVLQSVYHAIELPTDDVNLSFEIPLKSIGNEQSVYLVIPPRGFASYSNPILEWSYWEPDLKVIFRSVEYAMLPKDITPETSPYWRSNDDRGKSTIKLSAIPPRFYETVYNLYYRNPQNNPYILNGKPEYNIFIPTKDGGADSNLYQLRYRNWEDDFLTTAVQTPQQGIAPLVGLTDRGATVTLTNEDGSVTRYKTNLDEQGNVVGIETTDSSEPLLTQALIDAVSYGISIEDLRNVNAMQKWLELNLRKGYQYKDIIEARWGISISYNELDLPEFIGGFTEEVGLQAVTQTTSHGDTIEGALGWQAGRMYASGSGRSITHYCEEEGYIMALLCIVPVPNYSQLLPKHWFTRDLLESYQPEFNHIGFQPITYKEVCPIQAFQESTENVDVLEQTFGYQRPWYEYFNQVDEVHGQFRTTFKDFLINRTFDVKPELSESFLLVDPNQVNDVFAVQTDDDKIIGAIEHRITAKLPISLYAQARLE